MMQINIKNIIYLICLFSLSLQAENKRPNILWLITDNCNLDFGCYGRQNVHTPHIDELATQGMRFTRVFSTAPVCAPSRSAFMTGMYQTSVGLQHFPDHRDDGFRLPEGVRPLTHRLQDHGYFTASIKKIDDEVVGSGKLDLNFVNEGKIFQSTDWSKLKNNQPFFAQVNTPEAEYDIYDFKSNKSERVKWWGEDEHVKYAKPDQVVPPAYFPNHQVSREEWARYLNSVSGMDVRVGKVMDQLKKEGTLEDTIIILFGDNGRVDHRSIHWVYDTGLHVPMIIRWPKNFPQPKGYQPGGVYQEMVSLLDLTATTLDFAGIKRPMGMHSRVLMGEQADSVRKYAFSARDRVDDIPMRMRSVRGKRYRYIRNYDAHLNFSTYVNFYKEKCFPVQKVIRELYKKGQLEESLRPLFTDFRKEHLYDTEADPSELVNLVDSQDPRHQSVLVEMRAALDTWESETGDMGWQKESAEKIEKFRAVMYDWFGAPDWYPYQPKHKTSAQSQMNKGRIIEDD
jgi:arylsulfatase A-like enzyme